MTKHDTVHLELEEVNITATVTHRIFINSEGGGGHLNREFEDAEVLHVEIDEAINDDGQVEITTELLDKHYHQILEQWKNW